MRDRRLNVFGALAARAVEIGQRQVALALRPLAGRRLAHEYGERRLDVLDRPVSILGALALDAALIGTAEIVLGRSPQLRRGLAREHRQRLLEVLDGGLYVGGTLPSDTVKVGRRKVVLELRPRLRERLARKDGERGLEVGDGPFLIVGAIAADAAPIGDAGIVVRAGPILRVRLAGEDRERELEVRNGFLEVLGAHAERPARIRAAEAEPKLALQAVARNVERPRRELGLEEKRALAERDFLLGVLGLPPALKEVGKLGGLLLLGGGGLCPSSRRGLGEDRQADGRQEGHKGSDESGWNVFVHGPPAKLRDDARSSPRRRQLTRRGRSR